MDKRLLGHLLVVLRHHTQDHATLLQLLGPLLQFGEGTSYAQTMPQLYALESIIADYPTPQGVVEVEDEALVERAALGGYGLSDTVGHSRQCVD